jgi:hypothetical protein
MVAILAEPDAALTYMELYMKTYMEAYIELYTDGAFAQMDTALPQMNAACRMQKCKSAPLLGFTGGAVDDSPDDLQDIGFPMGGDKVFLTSDANQDSAKNRFLECSPEARGVPVVVLVDETDEFLVLMDMDETLCTPKRDPGVTWEDEDSKNQ